MRHLIEESKAYQALDGISQKIVNKKEVRLQIQDAVIQVRNIGIEAWRKITPLMAKHQKIVEEIAQNKIREKCEP